MDHLFGLLSRRVERAVGSPWASLGAIVLIVVWAAAGPFFDFNQSWQLFINSTTTVITFCVVFIIQATQTRDTEAIHVKLDELLRAVEGARTPVALAEDMDRKELDALHDELREVARREQEE